jgi:signal transduction histidine kinase
LAPDPVSERSESIYLISYGGRYVRAVRLVFLGVIVGTAFVGRPHPSLTGSGLVILVSLLVAAATHVALTLVPSGSAVIKAVTVLAAVSSGVVAGYEPSVGTAVLLVFVGLSAGASLELGQGGLVTALAVVTTAISVLAADQNTSNVALGAIAVVGFLGATGRKQYVLRAEEAELRLADAERAREEHARAVGLAERANAAREIHDILAHSLGALVLQLDALDAVLSGESPDRTRAAEVLARARALAVEGLNEARQAVGTLRADPPPLVDALRHVVDATPGATLEITGEARVVPAEVAVALRRTAQEGLTNAIKHVPGASTTVHLAFTPCEVVLSVTDTGCRDGGGPGPLAHTGGGYGIEGLRERAGLLGGTLVAGPHGAGWQVTLRVPEARLANEHVVETR